MKCAMEMKVAVEQKLLAEKMIKMEHYLTVVVPKLNAIVEELLLQGNGQAELMLDRSEDAYYLACKDYKSYPNNVLPYWGLRRDGRLDIDDIIYLECYKEFLESLCYNVNIIKGKGFKGCSSTGKSTGYVYYTALEISIPKTLNC